MDIGDPSEIPATRKRLPSMQELGAFDHLAPEGPATPNRPARVQAPVPPPAAPVTSPDAATPAASAPGPIAEPDQTPATVPSSPKTPSTPSTPSAPAPAAPRPALTPDQLRQALAKADPVTRQKLLRLIAGGRTIQQLTPASTPTRSAGPRAATLVVDMGARNDMAERARPASGQAPSRSPTSATPEATAASPAHSAFSSTPKSPPKATQSDPLQARAAPLRRASGESLMQIDANTELLDASPSAHTGHGDRHAGLQAQLDSARQQAAPPRPDPAAHKVLFPAYDPTVHGADVHTSLRRRPDGPVEGHFPAPRQPFRASYQHPDGKPMTPEESKVEEVLQAKRCEETLSVLAREGVNGLLLSPRDLDAAVNNGLLSAETAATLWRTWAALRPVIHVIEDEPPEPAAVPTPPSGSDIEPVPDGVDCPSTDVLASEDLKTAAAPTLAVAVALTETPPLMAVPVPAQAPVTAPVPVPTPLPVAPVAASPAPLPATPPVAPAAAPSRSRSRSHSPARPEPALATGSPPEAVTPAVALQTAPAVQPGAPAMGQAARARHAAWMRLKRLLTWVFWAFVAYSAITTGLKYGVALWNTGWGWALLDWLQQFRR